MTKIESDTPIVDAAECEIYPSMNPDYDGPCKFVESHIARHLERELAEARKDAERYRWLRDQCGSGGNLTIARVVTGGGFGCGLVGWSGDDPDKEIDAAITQKGAKE